MLLVLFGSSLLLLKGRGESTPAAYYYQNLGEAEYVVAIFQYMVSFSIFRVALT